MFDSNFTEAINLGLPETVALASVALFGYLFGRSQTSKKVVAERPEEYARATEIAHQLETIADVLRRDLAAHHAQVDHFKRRIELADGEDKETYWKELSVQAELVLEPTLRLVGQVASAYDQIRKQSKALSNFTGGRTDSLTGLCNSRALQELLVMELGGHQATNSDFSIAVISLELDPKISQEAKQEQIVRAAEFIQGELREKDMVARYGVEEFVIVMPNTKLFGASVFGRRLRKNLADKLRLVGNSGLTQSMPGDTPQSILSRADSALYSAKKKASEISAERATGNHVRLEINEHGLQFLHTGATIMADRPNENPISGQSEAPEEVILSFERDDQEVVEAI